jgi:hypothetical protein
MKMYGPDVKACAVNLDLWAKPLRELMKQILQSTPRADISDPVRKAVALADLMRNGTDLNGNQQIDPIPGEGGAECAYQYAYYMADMMVSPYVAPESPVGGTESGDAQVTSSPPPTSQTPTEPPQPTPQPANPSHPTKEPKPAPEHPEHPTKEPKPTKENKPTNSSPGINP